MPKLTNTTALPLALTHTDDAVMYIVDDVSGTPASKTIQVQTLGQGALTRDFGIVSCADNSTGQTISADTWTKLDRFSVATAGLQNGVTAVAAGGGSHYLRPSATGIYLCRYSASITTVGSAATIHTRIYKDSTGDTTSQSAHKLASGYTGNLDATASIDITSVSGTAGDISRWVKSDHTSIILSNGQLVIERLIST